MTKTDFIIEYADINCLDFLKHYDEYIFLAP